MFAQHRLTLGSIYRAFWRRISLTWALTFIETAFFALIPLFIGFAIDGLLEKSTRELFQLAGLMAALIFVATLRRIYDTRVYGTIRVEAGGVLADRGGSLKVSALNARVAMGRELVDFMETTLPEAVAAAVQVVIAIAILFFFSPVFALAAAGAAILLAAIYALFHMRFYRLNGALNQQVERQVDILDQRKARSLRAHFLRLRRMEVRISDTEAILYGLIFVVLLGFILFNLHFAATTLTVTVGTIFSIISYSWQFVESALALPITLQALSRLAEITERLNGEVQE